MKKLLYLLSLIILTSACRSVEKAMDRGDYEQAIFLAKKRTAGKKNKSTKNVQYLEEAYAKILKRDLNAIKILQDEKRPENLDEIFVIYADIDARQEAIRPLLPLISKDGYKAEFKFMHVDGLMKETSEKAAAYHYKNALNFLTLAEQGDKYSARKALKELDIVNRYFKHYDDVDALRDKARFLGKTRVLVKTENRTLVNMPFGFEQDLLAINVKSLNTLWTEYYTTAPTHAKIDVVSEIELRNFEVSPEREFVREYTDSKEVQNGFEYFYDTNGNVAKDTLGNDIKRPRMVNIFADVLEIRRDKFAKVGGVIKFYDARSKEMLKSRNFEVESGFQDIAGSYRGDRRALSQASKKCLKSNPLPFPTDASLALDAAGKLKSIMKKEMKKFII